ncbi:MAG: surface lipoprotein assembly modifier [Siculibacillus sp.]
MVSRHGSRRGLPGLLVAAAVAVVVSPQSGHAQPAPVATARPSPMRAHLLTIEAMIEQGRIVEARDALAATPRTEEFARVYGGFLDARIAEATGDLSAARDGYRAILAERPELARVRHSLARVLAAIGDHQAARHHYELILGADVGSDVAERLRNDIDAMNRAKHWTAQVMFSLVPTSNLSNGTAAGSVLIGGIPFVPAAAAQQKGGLAAVYGVQIAHRMPVFDDMGILSTFGTTHTDGPGRTWDQRTVEATIGPQFRLGAGVVTLEALASRTWFGVDPYSLTWGARLGGRFLLSDQWRLTASTTLTRQQFDQAPWQTGPRSTTTVALDRSMGSHGFVRLKATHDHQKAELAHLSHHDIGGSIGFYWEAPWGITVFPEVGHAERYHTGDFPLTSSPRHDRRTSIGTTVTKRDLSILGLAPKLIYSYTRNTSNIDLYTYSRHDLNLTLTKEF